MNLYRSFATVGALTMVSRVLGFVRDILIAFALGSGWIADAFFVAFRFPNLFRRLFGEGAFNSAFVPLYAKRLEAEGEASADGFASTALAGLGLVLAVLSALMIAGMPWLILALAPGFAGEPVKLELAVWLTQLAFPYLLCMSLVALVSGVLNSRRHFFAAAAAPILLNLTLITAIVLAMLAGYGGRSEAGVVLAVAVTVAGVGQLTMVWVAARRAGAAIRVAVPTWNEDMRRLVRLGIPGLISGGVTQINIVIGTIIASLQAGAVSYLYYADRLYQLPLGIVGVAIGVVLLPDLSRHLGAGNRAAALDSLNRALELSLLITLPAAVGLTLAAGPIVSVLFERGAFTPADTLATSAAVVAFALGLPAFVLIKVLQPAFFAREDTRTPMRFTIVNLVVNAVGSVGLFLAFREFGLMAHVGIALATTLAAWINVALLWGTLVQRGEIETDKRLKRNVPLTVLAAAVMGGCLVIGAWLLAPFLVSGAGTATRFGALALLVAGAGTLFGLVVVATGVIGLDQIGRFLSRRR
jgi:putative peptidoglycan lipid II flippase